MNRASFFIGNNFFYQIATICVVGLILGAVALFLPPLWVVGIMAGGVFAFAMIKRPEIGLLGILVATSSIVFEDSLPLLPLGPVGSLHISDLILLALLGLIVFRWLTEQDFKLAHTPLDLPLLAFYVLTLLATSKAVLQSSVELYMARRAIRVMTYYLTFFIVTNLVREKRQLFLLMKGISIIALISAGVMVTQFVLGESVAILPGRVETLRTAGETFGRVTRIVPPARSLILLSFITITVLLVLVQKESAKTLYFFQWILLGFALITTFLRSYWAVCGFSLFLLLFFLKGQDRQRMVRFSLLVVFLLIIIVLVSFYNPDSRSARLTAATLDRMSTLFVGETIEESSLQGRFVENRYALSRIISNPWLGIGYGARYRPWNVRIDGSVRASSGFDSRTFLHNGHLWVMMASGLLGYVALIWISLIFMIRGLEYWRYASSVQLKGIVLGFSLSYVAVFIMAIVNSSFVQWRWTPVLGIMMGVNEVIIQRFSVQAS